MSHVPTTILHYFPGRGLANVIRYTMALAGMEWTEAPVASREAMVALLDSGRLPFRQIPLVEIDGLELVESTSITRYIAETRCLAGEAASERVAIDTLATAATELYFRICAISFQPSEEAKATFINDLLRPKFFTKALPAFEKAIADSGGPYLMGSSAYYCDAALYCMLEGAKEVAGETLQDYPKLCAHVDAMESRESFGAFLKSRYHFPKPDEDYVRAVNVALGRA